MPARKTKKKAGTAEILQEWELDAPPEVVYKALLDSRDHAAFTGYPAWIDPRPAGFFRTCGNRNFGYTLAIRHNRRVVQAWSHKSFPADHWSIVDFSLAPLPEQRTLLTFTHTGFPAAAKKWLEPGWKQTYWQALDRWLVKRGRVVPIRNRQLIELQPTRGKAPPDERKKLTGRGRKPSSRRPT